jgi:hypothetical protein
VGGHVKRVHDSLGVTEPVALGVLFYTIHDAGVADQNGLLPLPGSFEPEVVINATIGEHHLRGKGWTLEIHARIGRIV